MLYLEGSLGNTRMQAHNFEIDGIELFLNLHKIFYWVRMFLYPLPHTAPIDLQVKPQE